MNTIYQKKEIINSFVISVDLVTKRMMTFTTDNFSLLPRYIILLCSTLSLRQTANLLYIYMYSMQTDFRDPFDLFLMRKEFTFCLNMDKNQFSIVPIIVLEPLYIKKILDIYLYC